MIVLFTDFGLHGPYVGQMKAVLAREAPGIPVIDLLADAPTFNPRAAAYLLAACVREFPENAVFLCVVDPGVGGDRLPLTAQAGGRWYVGPDNGLLSIVLRRDSEARAWSITWRPERLSASFHGRDLFAPVAARLAAGAAPTGHPMPVDALHGADWPDDLTEIVYVDAYGNAMTGLRASLVSRATDILTGGHRVRAARTFSDVDEGQAFWYENALGLVEIAVNQGHAANALGLAIGHAIDLTASESMDRR